MNINRKDFLKLAGLGGVVFASGLGGVAALAEDADKDMDDFFFVQLTDTHWGFNDPNINPESQNTLKKAVAAVNSLEKQPDFVVFTGDLTDLTEDVSERKRRMDEFKTIVSGLKCKQVRFMPGEHDASLDAGAAFQQFFGKTRYAFDHKGVHFVALDNVSDPHGAIGDVQLKWLASHLKGRDRAKPIVVLTHRPLFDLAPAWDWATPDGAKAVELLLPFKSATVFYGHIHQVHHYKTDHIEHHAGESLMFPLPAPMSLPKKKKVAWNPDKPFAGLGFREVKAEVYGPKTSYDLDQRELAG